MWPLIARAFLWLSAGSVLNDIAGTVRGWFGGGDADKKDSAPWWVAPVVIISLVIAFIVWLAKRKR